MLESIKAVGLFQTLVSFNSIEGPIKESAFCPMLVFRYGQINFRRLFLALKLFGQANSKTSFR